MLFLPRIKKKCIVAEKDKSYAGISNMNIIRLESSWLSDQEVGHTILLGGQFRGHDPVLMFMHYSLSASSLNSMNIPLSKYTTKISSLSI